MPIRPARPPQLVGRVFRGSRVVSAGLLTPKLPDGAGFTGLSAAVLWGVPDVAKVDDPVEVILPRGSRWNTGGCVRTSQRMPGQELARRGLWLCASRADAARADPPRRRRA